MNNILEYPDRQTVTGLILDYAARFPQKTALVADGKSMTYAQLGARIRAAAYDLIQRGVRRHSHVVSVAAHEVDFVVTMYALLGLGAMHIPAEHGIPNERLRELAGLVDAEFIISDEDPCCGVQWISAVGEGEQFDPNWQPICVTDDCTELIFTTGTTGKSKGVMLSSHCLDTYLCAINPSFGMDMNTVFLITTPLNHVGGLHRLHQCMSSGACAVLMDGITNLRAVFNNIEIFGVTHLYLPPAAVRTLLSLAKKKLASLDGKLKFVFTASAPFPSADIETLMQLLPNTRLHQGYGSTETGSVCNNCYNAPGSDIMCLGVPYPGVFVKLLDEDGNVVEGVGKEGYICVKSDMIMLGYYREPELTDSVLKDGYIVSSDLGYFDENGGLHFAGRSGDVINIRGFKVAPTEVESAALKDDCIVDCACYGVENAIGISLRMLVVLREGVAFEPHLIAQRLSRLLEPYKVPASFVAVDKIPRTANGKIDRKRLHEFA